MQYCILIYALLTYIIYIRNKLVNTYNLRLERLIYMATIKHKLERAAWGKAFDYAYNKLDTPDRQTPASYTSLKIFQLPLLSVYLTLSSILLHQT